MKNKELRNFLEKFDDDIRIEFILHPSYKSLYFRGFDECYVCKTEYQDDRRNEEFLSIVVENDD